jgi:hypothetical protein
MMESAASSFEVFGQCAGRRPASELARSDLSLPQPDIERCGSFQKGEDGGAVVLTVRAGLRACRIGSERNKNSGDTKSEHASPDYHPAA